MEITLVKAAGPGEGDRVYLEVDGSPGAARFTSSTTFRILWWNPCSASETGCGQNWPPVGTPRRAGRRRLVTPGARSWGGSSPAPQLVSRPGEWLTPGHQRAKTITNCVANRFGDGPDTPDGVRDRAAQTDDRALGELLTRQ